MNIKRIADPEERGHYTMFTATDFEYVNPIEYYETTTKRVYFEMERDLLVMMKPPFPIPIIERVLRRRAEENWKERYQSIISTPAPEALISLLKTDKKKEQEALLKGLSITADQLISFIFKAWTDFGFRFSQYTAEFQQKGVKLEDLPKIINTEDGKIKKVGETKLSDAQLKQAVDHRRVTVSKFFDNGQSWHCLFVTFKSLRGEEPWKDGQPHYHYISDKFGLSRKRVLTELKSWEYNLGSLPHIDLLDYRGEKKEAK